MITTKRNILAEIGNKFANPHGSTIHDFIDVDAETRSGARRKATEIYMDACDKFMESCAGDTIARAIYDSAIAAHKTVMDANPW